MWWVYVLECRGGRLYTGATADLARRLAAHAAGRGGRFTRAFPPVRLRAARRCRSRGAALALEARVKRLPAALKIASLRARRSRETAPGAPGRSGQRVF